MNVFTKYAIVTILLGIAALTSSAAVHSFRILVDSAEVDTIIQGTPYFLEIICDPGDTFASAIIVDTDLDGEISTDDFVLTNGITWDNITPHIGGMEPLETDLDTSWGRLLIMMPISLSPCRIFFVIIHGADSTIRSFYQAPPDPVLYSVSGKVELEGLASPDTLYKYVSLFTFNSSVGMMVTLVDSTGNYSTNWPFPPETAIVSINILGSFEGYRDQREYFSYELGYDLLDNPETTLFIDGHLTDVDFYIPLWIPDTGRVYGEIHSSDGEPVNAESLLVVENIRLVRAGPEPEEYIYEYDTFYVDVVDCEFDLKVPMGRSRWDGIIGSYWISEHHQPEGFMRKNRDFANHFNTSLDDPIFELTDTIYAFNSTSWVSYYTFLSGYDSVKTKIFDHNLYTTALLHRDSLVEIPFYKYPGGSLLIGSEPESPISYPDDIALLDLYGLPSALLGGDTLTLQLVQLDANLACSCFCPEGELVSFENQNLRINVYESGFLKSVEIIDGAMETHVLAGKHYGLWMTGYFPGWMSQFYKVERFDPGENYLRWDFYPLDTTFYLYVEVAVESPADDSFGVMVYSPDHLSESFETQRFMTNRWEKVKMPGNFFTPCNIEIGHKEMPEGSSFYRLIENNGNISVNPGDSIRLFAELPIDTFVLDLTYDPADTHSRQPNYLNNFYMDYFDIEDSSLVFRLKLSSTEHVLSKQLPIFERRLLFNITPINRHFRKHDFIANHDQHIIVGGPYRPDRITKYLNYGSGEMLMTLDGYPAEYLGSDTLWLPHGDFSCVEIPDYPTHNYIADLIFFKTYPMQHPYGDGSVMSFHDVCDGQWTVHLPDSFPGGFVPTVTETSFFCADIASYPDEWQEFPIRIPVIRPPGITGRISRDNTFFSANQMVVDIIDASGTVVLTKTPWQVHPWGTEAVYIEYFSKEGEIPHGDYKTVLHYLGWDPAFVFIYPDTVYFSYHGGSVEIEPFYIGFRRSNAKITVVGLEDSLREGAYFRLTPLEGTHPMIDAPFYAINAEFPFPDGADTAVIPLPERTWVITPLTESGLIPTPPVATLNVPIGGTSGDFRLNFDYSGYENSGAIAGRIITDSTSVDPYPIDSLKIKILSSSGATLLREVTPNSEGYFIAENLLSPSMLTVQITSDSERPLFAEKKEFAVSVATGDTTHVGNIFIADGNIRARIRFRGLNTLQLATFSQIRAYPLENEWMADTVYLNFSSGASTDTFRLCSGRWQIFSPRVPGAYLLPEFYDTLMIESSVYYDLEFIYPEGLKENEFPREFDFSAFPNPFNDAVVFKISLPEDSQVLIEIFDMSGRKVNHINTQFKAGIHRLIWNAKGYGGADLNSGVYLYRVETYKETRTAKGVYLK